MLDGFIPWPKDAAEKYIKAGLWEERTITDMVYAVAARHPDKIAVIDGQSQYTYGQLRQRVDRLACRLLREGMGPRDRIVMQLPNSAEFIFAYLAITRIGAIPVMALRAHRETEILHFVRSAAAAGYMIPAEYSRFDYRRMAEAVARQCPSLRRTFVLGQPAAGQVSLTDMFTEPLDEAVVAAELAKVSVDPSEVATMLLSGGTTSMSKLIPRTHNDFVLNARLCGKAGGFDENTVFMAVLPLGHNYNLASPGMLAVFYFGGTVLVGAGTDAEVVFPQIAKHRVNVIAAAVPLIANWLQSTAAVQHDLSSLKVIQNGGARLAPELRRRIMEQLHCIPQEVYGTAEGLINMTRLDDPEDLLLESSGAPVCDEDEIKVVDDDGNEVPDGEAGELLCRGPYTIQGYYNAPEKNKEAFTEDGFYRMGDVVRKRGRYVFAEGRKKDLINRGGEKISCEEVEDLIFKHPAVHQVALVAMPDPVFGEKACAFVVTKPGQTLTFEELIGFLKKQNIASFKLPERLEVVEQFPTSLVGKILKRQLRETILAKLTEQGWAIPKS